jgi:glycosyltransferase involved in cell wall biosynthesis/ubiquinone/menaquinone biosynthesis C-methylase UbiE
MKRLPMKILKISPKKPYPLTDGGKIVAYNTIKYLAMQGHEITLVSIVDKEEGIPELEKFCEWIPIQKDTATTTAGLLGNLFSKKPYTISKYHSEKIKQKIRGILKENNFDIVHIDGLHTAYYGTCIKQEFGLPVVLRELNVEARIMERFYKNQKNPLIKAYAYLQHKKLSRYEATICEVFDKCFMITKEDERRIKEMNPRVKTNVIPSGVDTSYFYPMEAEEEPLSIVSVASMDWLPNNESIIWFCNSVFPLIKKEIPGAKLYVVGKNPSNKIKKLASKDIIVTGFVEDEREYMAKSQVFIVPLKTGSGMRIKILNALAMGKAVISTPIGCEGIEVQHRKNVYIADTEKEFAQGAIELLKNKDIREGLGEEGLRFVKEKYQWERIAEEITENYRKIADFKNRHWGLLLSIEKEFHNKQAIKATTSGFYEFGVLEYIDDYCFNLLKKEGLVGKNIVDYGCGSGWNSIRLAKEGANVFAFDISEMMIKTLKYKTQQENLEERITAKEMAAESLEYPDESVDGIIGLGILHHVNLDSAIPEVYRVLKPGGKAVFREPLDGNPIINLFRYLTPKRRTPTEKPLSFSDIKKFEKFNFKEVKHAEFYLFALLSFALIGFKNRKLYNLAFTALNKIDSVIFKIFPWVRKYTWITIIEVTK